MRRRRDPDDASEAGWVQLARLTQSDDSPLDTGRGLVRTRVRPARPIHQTSLDSSTLAQGAHSHPDVDNVPGHNN
jgi:hypothetical protein